LQLGELAVQKLQVIPAEKYSPGIGFETILTIAAASIWGPLRWAIRLARLGVKDKKLIGKVMKMRLFPTIAGSVICGIPIEYGFKMLDDYSEKYASHDDNMENLLKAIPLLIICPAFGVALQITPYIIVPSFLAVIVAGSYSDSYEYDVSKQKKH